MSSSLPEVIVAFWLVPPRVLTAPVGRSVAVRVTVYVPRREVRERVEAVDVGDIDERGHEPATGQGGGDAADAGLAGIEPAVAVRILEDEVADVGRERDAEVDVEVGSGRLDREDLRCSTLGVRGAGEHARHRDRHRVGARREVVEQIAAVGIGLDGEAGCVRGAR